MGKPRLRSPHERGAVLVHVGIALLVLLGFSAIVLDYGILWVSRAQAQNAADAGALAGAVSLAFESGDNLRDTGGPAATAAAAAADQNSVWGQPAGVTADVPEPISFPTCPDGTDTCVRVNVYRNTDHNNPLPVFFARLFGVNEQGVRAMATAQAAVATSADCLRPWAIADKWAENVNPQTPYPSADPRDLNWSGWTPNSVYDIFDSKGNPLTGTKDVYTPPTVGAMGTGFSNRDPVSRIPIDYGKLLSIKLGQAGSWSPGWAMKVDFPLSTGGSDYGWNIKNCNPGEMYIASPTETCDPATLPADRTLWFARGCFSVLTGVDVGNTDKGVFRDADSLKQQDIDAGCYSRWDWSARGGIGGIVVNEGCARERSPLLVPVPVYDVDMYLRAGYNGTNGVFRMVNIVGFFIEGSCDDLPKEQMDYLGCTKGAKDIYGRIVDYPGMRAGQYNGQASFLRVIRLVR